MVKRYVCKLLNGMADAKLFHHPGEQFVLASDYDTLESRIRELEIENARLSMEMAAYREKLTPQDAAAMVSIISALYASKSESKLDSPEKP